MSTPDSTSPVLQKVAPVPLGQLSVPAETFPGFALPEAVLHSIPLPAEFAEFVRLAITENQVKTILPVFFNPLFRRQGVLNKHTIHALESVGQSLAHLAREIEGRDRILEQLTSHLNAYREHAHREHLGLVHFAGQLASQVGEVAGNLRARLDREATEARLRTDTMLAITRSAERRLGDQQAALAEINHRIEATGLAAEQREALLREQTVKLAVAHERTSDQLAQLRRQSEEMLAHTQASAARLAEVQTLAAAATEQVRRDAQNLIADLATRTGMQLAEQRESLLRVQTEHTAPAFLAMEERLTRIEARLAEQAAGEIRAEVLLSAARATGQAQEVLSSELQTLRTDLCALAEMVAILGKRQESTEASLGGTKAAIDTLLPALQTQMAHLGTTTPKSRRQAAAAEVLATIKSAQLAESDGLYAAVEARFRGSRALIRERQTKYLPVIEEARKRVGLFPPLPQDSRSVRMLEQVRAGSGVLDLGCGRGEWLELLKEHGIPGLGVDRNRFFLDYCRERNCAVADADIMAFLRNTPDESVAVVTSFQVIEHLPIPVFQEMAHQVLRILRRGGTAIFETPNPGNVLTAGLNFLLDPTHLRPVHPEFARLILETSGFSAVQLQFTSPYDETHRVGRPDDPLAQRFNEYFYGPQDYAVIGVKP